MCYVSDWVKDECDIRFYLCYFMQFGKIVEKLTVIAVRFCND